MKSSKIKSIIITALFLLSILPGWAQSERNKFLERSEINGWEYELRTGILIGGTLPMPFPVEIRSIEKYNPQFNGFLEGTVTKRIGSSKTWGISSGLRVEKKGMNTGAKVKDYSMELIQNTGYLAGRWTGRVNTKYSATFLTIPVLANYLISSRWKARAGLYASYMLEGDFSGYVTDGYLREGSPVGPKTSFGPQERSTYNFSSNLRKFQWGAQVGASWKAYKHFSVVGDLTWGFNDVFQSSFKTITFSMYPVYLNLGFSYQF